MLSPSLPAPPAAPPPGSARSASVRSTPDRYSASSDLPPPPRAGPAIISTRRPSSPGPTPSTAAAIFSRSDAGAARHAAASASLPGSSASAASSCASSPARGALSRLPFSISDRYPFVHPASSASRLSVIPNSPRRRRTISPTRGPSASNGANSPTALRGSVRSILGRLPRIVVPCALF